MIKTVRKMGSLVGLAKTRVYSAAGSGEGFDMRVDLDYATDDVNLPEPWMIRVRDGAGNLKRAFWPNESGLLRLWAIRKDEPCLKLHAFSNTSNGPVLEVRGIWNGGNVRRWAIDGQGNLRLGDAMVYGQQTIALPVGSEIPSGLPDRIAIDWYE